MTSIAPRFFFIRVYFVCMEYQIYLKNNDTSVIDPNFPFRDLYMDKLRRETARERGTGRNAYARDIFEQPATLKNHCQCTENHLHFE